MLARTKSIILAASTILCSTAFTLASDDVFDPNTSGFWGVGASWQDNTTPGNNDTASFSLAGSPIVTFNAAPAAIQSLAVTQAPGAGSVIMQSSGGPFTLNVTSATGTQNVTLTNRNLVLGNAGNPLHLTVGNTTTVNGATLSVTGGSKVLTTNANIGFNADGTVIVDGAGSEFRWGSILNIGNNGNDGVLTYSNSASTGANGIFANEIRIANSTFTGTTGILNVLSGASVSIDGSLFLSDTSSTAKGIATINVQGASFSMANNSSLVRIGGIVGSGAAGNLNIGTTQGGATFTAGAGDFRIFPTGTVNVGGVTTTGTLDTRRGALVVDGHLNVNQAGTFQHRNVYIQGIDSAMTINGNYNISEFLSEQIMSIGSGSLTTSGQIDIAIGSDDRGGALYVFLGGSVISNSTSPSNWGSANGHATVEFAENSTGTFHGGLDLASSNGTTTVKVDVFSGADLTVGDMNVATTAANNTVATITVSGAGSTLNIDADHNLVLGRTSASAATLNLRDSGALNVGAGGSITINPTATVNLDGGSLTTPTLTNNGTLNFNGGTIVLTSPDGAAIGSAGPLGSSVSLGSGKTLSVTNTTNINGGAVLTLDGGTFNTGALVKAGAFVFNSGTLGITGSGGLLIGSGGLLGTNLTLGNGKIVNVSGTTSVAPGSVLALESDGQINTNFLANLGTLSLDGANAVIGSTGAATMGNTGIIRGTGQIAISLNNFGTGEVRAESGHWLRFTSGSPNTSSSGRITLMGGVLEFNQSLTNGSSGQILGHGTLITRGTGLINNGQLILSGDATSIYGDVTNNTGSATKGITVSGNTNVTFWDDVAHAAGSMFKVQAGSSVTFFGTFSGGGSITGGGNVFMEADLTPGTSPASVTYTANVFLGDESTTVMELGGAAAGTGYDQLSVVGNLSLDGQLVIALINSFTPAAGQSFNIFDWTGSRTGTFDALTLPTLSGLSWDTSTLYTDGIIKAVAASDVPGDFNHDGRVDSADYVIWRKGANGIATTQVNYDLWRENYGRTSSGSGGDSPIDGSVPEPTPLAAISLLSFAAACRWRSKES